MITRRGFTLIEVLAATALSAIMMTALMSVTTAITRNEPAGPSADQSASLRRNVIEVFRRDLAHADTVDISSSRVTFTGHVGIDRKTMAPGHRPAVVTYSLRRLADRSWLIRTQTDTEDRSLRNTWVQLVCADVLSFEIQTGEVSVDALNSPAPGFPQATETDTGVSTLTDSATLTIIWDDDKQSTTSVVLINR